MKEVKIFDSYAFLIFFQDENNADKVEELLLKAEEGKITILLSVINLGEIYYTISRKLGRKIAEQKIEEINRMAVDIVPADKELTLMAAGIKASHPMSYADCFAAALTQKNRGELVTGDREFKEVEKEISIFWI